MQLSGKCLPDCGEELGALTPFQELIRTRAAAGVYNLDNEDRVYLQRDGDQASGLTPENKDVRVSSYSYSQMHGAWTRLDHHAKWRNLARNHVQQRRLAAPADIFMMIYHYSEIEDEVSDNRLSRAKLKTPLVGEVFTDTEPVVMQARRRGHVAMHPSITLSTGYDLMTA